MIFNEFGEYGNIKDYLVTHKNIPNLVCIVSTCGPKTAIHLVYLQYKETTYEEDFRARSLTSLHSEHGKIINLRRN
jgi:hypothetical protein